MKNVPPMDELLDGLQEEDVYVRARDAIKDCEILGPTRLAEAITSGLYVWIVPGNKSQADLMLEVMRALADQTGKPIEIIDKTEEHK